MLDANDKLGMFISFSNSSKANLDNANGKRHLRNYNAHIALDRSGVGSSIQK